MSSLSRESCISTAPSAADSKRDAECLKRQIVFRGRSQDLVIGGGPLRADEPVAFRAKQIPRDDRLQVILGLQRLTGPEIVVVVVLDMPEHGEGHDAMVIGTGGCPGKHAGDL